MGFDDLDKLMESELEASKDGKTKSESPKPQIMVVDDDPQLLDAMKTLLEDKYELVLCKNGEEALAKVEATTHAVLLDIKMSGMNGFEVFRRIKSKFNHLPIIFHTAHQDSFDPYDVLNKLRPYGYLQKGQDEERLLAVLDRAVRYRQKFLKSEIKLAELITYRKRLEEEITTRNSNIENLKRRLPGSGNQARGSVSSRSETDPSKQKHHENRSLLGLGEVLVSLKHALVDAAQKQIYLSFAILEINDLDNIRQQVGATNLDPLVDAVAASLGNITEDISGRAGSVKLAIIMPNRNESSASDHISAIQRKLALKSFPFGERSNNRLVYFTTSAAIITVKEKTPPEARSVIFAAEKVLTRTRRPITNTCAVETLDTD